MAVSSRCPLFSWEAAAAAAAAATTATATAGRADASSSVAGDKGMEGSRTTRGKTHSSSVTLHSSHTCYTTHMYIAVLIISSLCVLELRCSCFFLLNDHINPA